MIGCRCRSDATPRPRPRMSALPQAGGAVRLRRHRADRQPRVGSDPPASPGAGPSARHRAADGAQFARCRRQGRAVMAEPAQNSRPHRRSASLGGALSRLRQGGELAPGSRDRLPRSQRGRRARSGALLRDIEGVVLLDGNWSQAKALWWRNPWMLKCRRVILGPRRPSRYGSCAASPAATVLSTIEAAGMLVSRLKRAPRSRKRSMRASSGCSIAIAPAAFATISSPQVARPEV